MKCISPVLPDFSVSYTSIYAINKYFLVSNLQLNYYRSFKIKVFFKCKGFELRFEWVSSCCKSYIPTTTVEPTNVYKKTEGQIYVLFLLIQFPKMSMCLLLKYVLMTEHR